MSSEYSAPMSNAPACAYHTLCNYNQGSQMAPINPNAKPVVGKYVVPAWNAIGYDALTHNQVGSCGGYFNITNAYGKGAAKCNQAYVTSLCGQCKR